MILSDGYIYVLPSLSMRTSIESLSTLFSSQLFSILAVGGEHVLLIVVDQNKLKKVEGSRRLQAKIDFNFVSDLGLVHTKIDALDTYRLCF